MIAATSVAGAGVVIPVAVALVESLEPTAAEAAAASTTVNLAPVEPGMQLTVPWQKKPVIIVNRTPEMLTTLVEAEKKGILKDPDCKVSPYMEKIRALGKRAFRRFMCPGGRLAAVLVIVRTAFQS